MFEYQGNTYTIQDLQQAAAKRGMDFNSYLNVMKNAGLKEISDTEQPAEVTQSLQQTSNQDSNWFEQALQAGKVNADLYDDADAIFDISSSTEVKSLSNDQLKAYISLIQQSQASAAQMEELNKFTTAFKKYNSQGENWAMSTINAIKETGNVKGFAQSAIQSFRSMANKELAKEAIAPTVTAAGAGAAATAYGFGIGAIPAAFTGFFGSMNYGLETINTFNELLQEEIKNANLDFNPDSIRKILADDTIRKRIKARARKRGLTIGTVEGLTTLVGVKGAGAVGKAIGDVSTTVGRIAKTTAQTAITTPIEAVGGGLGEFLGAKAAGKEATGVDVILEGLSGSVVSGPIDASVAAVDLTINRPSYEIDGRKVKRQSILDYVENEDITSEQLAELDIKIENDASLENKVAVAQQRAIIDKNLDPSISKEKRNKLIDLELKRLKLKQDIKKQGENKLIDTGKKLKDVESQINDIIEGVEDVTLEDTQAAVQTGLKEIAIKKDVAFAKKYARFYDLEVNELKDQAAVDKYIKDNNITDQDDLKALETAGYVDEKTGEIVINRQKALELNNVTVGNHELLHGILRKAVKEGKISKKLIDNIKNKYGKALEKRLQPYQNLKIKGKAYLEVNPDEYITQLSEAVQAKEITLDQSALGKFKELILPILRTFGFGKIDFETVEGVESFLREYSTSVKTGKLSKGLISQTASKREGATGKAFSIAPGVKKDLTEEQATTEINNIGKRNEFGDDLEGQDGNAMWKAVEGDDAARRIQEQGLLDKLILKKPHVGVDDASFLSATYTALLPHIRNYKPERKNPNGLFGWINPQIGNKAKQAYNDLQKGKTTQPTVDIGQTTKEGEVKVQVAADKDVAMQELETKDVSIAAQIKEKQGKKPRKVVYSKLRQDVGIETGSDIYNRILESVKKSLFAAYAKTENITNVKERVDNIVEMLRKEYTTKGNFTPIFKQIKNLLSEGKYIDNLKKYKEVFIEQVKTADLVQMLREAPEGEQFGLKFVAQLTNKADVKKYVDLGKLPKDSLNKMDKGQAINLYEKTKPTDEKIVAFADKPPINPETGKRSGLKGTRKDNFAKRFQQIFVDDAIMQVRQSEEFKAMIDKKVSIENDIQELAAAVDKDVNRKFSLNDNLVFNLKNALDTLIQETSDQNLRVTSKDFKSKVIIVNRDEDGKLLNVKFKKEIKGVRGGKIKQSQQDFVAKLAYDIMNARNYEKATKINIYKKPLYKLIEQRKAKNEGEAFELLNKNEIDKNLPKNAKIVDGYGDIYIRVGDFAIGIEVKLGEAQGVSQFLSYTKDGVNFPNKNTTINQDTNRLYDDEIADLMLDKKNQINKKLKQAGLDTIENFSTKLSQEQINILKPYRHEFIINTSVPLEYFMSAYANGKYAKDPQGVLLFENFLFLMETGVDAVDNKSIAFADEFKNITGKEITKLKLDGVKNIEVAVNLDIVNGQLKFRLRPLIDINNFNTTNAVEVNKVVYKNIGKAVESASKKFSLNNKNANLSKASINARQTLNYDKNKRGMSTFDFDETLIDKGENFIIAKKDNEEIKISSSEWPIKGPELDKQGYSFDFTDFVNVRGGIEGPLLQKMRNQIKKFGSSNVFVLTARPPESAKAIHGWLKTKGINISLDNITGLGNSTGQAKALWMAEKFSQGYNDMYFVDDALPNVKAVKDILDQLDVKSKVVQARKKFSLDINKSFNDILEQVTSIESNKRFSDAKARKRGEGKGRFRFFVPPSHEDFIGLLYNFIGKGEQGNKHRDFFEKTLVQPLNRAYRELNMAKQAIANDYRNLTKQMPDIRKKLTQKTPDGDFTYDDAVRVYLWKKAGFDIPGLSETDTNNLVELVNIDDKLKAFADKVGQISKIEEGYVEPGEHWISGNIRQDLVDATGRVGRAKFFTDFIENADVIFSSENINKIRAAYGDNFVEALQDMLSRIKTGTNRKQGGNRQVNSFLDYLNGSIGATMFFNARSAVLQTLSAVNFINFADNNIFKAAKAFANQQQFWSDFAKLFNSDFLKQRRAGVGFDVNGAEIASAVKKAKNPVKAAIAFILNKGFLPTQMADSFAIAIGGSTFYRNRIDTYVKQGLSQKEAETKAFEDFQATAESTQQSARPDMISQQQASVLGRMILAFQNVTSQYVRLIKKAGSDLINRRKTPPYATQVQSDMSNISKIIYYGAIQNLIFYGLQSALFAMAFEDDEQDDKFFKNKKQRLLNGSIDSILRGSGVGGAIVSVLKNAVIKYGEQKEKGWGKQLGVISDELLQLSPPVGIKIRKLDSFEKTMEYNKKVIPEMSKFDIDNPIWDAYGNLVEGATNVPVARLLRKVENVRTALDSENAWWQRLALGLGWSKWELGIEDKEIKEVKEQIKKTNKQINKETKRKKKSGGLPVFN
tara:strand:- start:261 stop:7424 length:7164 start_codon:yes stop_codon:yes gene_type:complete